MVRESRHSRRSLPGARAVARRRRRRRRGAIVLTLVFAVVVGGAALALAPDRADGNSSGVRLPAAPSNVPLRTFAAPHPPAPAPPRASAAAPAVAPALVRAAATPPGPPPWPNPAPPLPNPAPVPDPGHNVALMDVGRIDIPKIGLDQPVREGVEQMVIDAGPAHWRGTAAFGAWGNVVVAGHRATHTAPFRRAAELVPGDEILLADPRTLRCGSSTRLPVER